MKKNKLINWWLDVALLVAQVAASIDADLSWVAAVAKIVRAGWWLSLLMRDSKVLPPARELDIGGSRLRSSTTRIATAASLATATSSASTTRCAGSGA